MIRLRPSVRALAEKRAAEEDRSLASYISRLIEADAKAGGVRAAGKESYHGIEQPEVGVLAPRGGRGGSPWAFSGALDAVHDPA